MVTSIPEKLGLIEVDDIIKYYIDKDYFTIECGKYKIEYSIVIGCCEYPEVKVFVDGKSYKEK